MSRRALYIPILVFVASTTMVFLWTSTWRFGSSLGQSDLNPLLSYAASLCYVVTSLSTLLISIGISKGNWKLRFGQGLAASVLIFITPELFLRLAVPASTLHSFLFPFGQISPLSVLTLTFLNVGLILGSSRMTKGVKFAQFFCTAAIFIAALALVGYCLGEKSLYQIGQLPRMSLLSAIFSLTLGLTALALRPDVGIPRIVLGQTSGGFMARRLLLPAVLVPLCLGWIVLSGRHLNLYDNGFAISIFVLAVIVIFVGLVIQSAGALDQTDARLEYYNNERIRSLAEVDALLTGTPVGTCFVDPKYKIIRTNKSFANFFDVSMNDIHGVALGQLFKRSKHFKETFEDLIDSVFATGKSVSNYELSGTMTDSNGELSHWLVNLYPVIVPVQGVLGVGIAIVDIAALKNAEISLAQSREQLEQERLHLRAVIRNMPTGMVIGEAHTGQITLGNDQVSKILRVPDQRGNQSLDYTQIMKQLRGFKMDDTPLDRRDWPLERAIYKGERVENEEISIIRADGTRGTLSVNAAPISDESGRMIAGVCLFYDVTDRKLAERELLSARDAAEASNAAKTAFLANMSHEIRTPLGAIMGFAELMQAPGQSRSEIDRYSKIIRRNSEQLLTLIDDILDLSKVEAGKITIERIDIPVQTVVADVISLLGQRARDKKVGFYFESQGPIPEIIQTDPTRMRQVLVNIIGNAIKFTEAGFIKVLLKYEADTDRLLFQVRDTGIGITQEQQMHLFEPFSQADASTTRRFGGTGLGLVLSKRLCMAMGGNLVLHESEIGRGSTFILSVGANRKASTPMMTQFSSVSIEPPMAPVMSFDRERLKNIHFLIVDDSPDNQALIGRFVKLAGATFDVANNGLEALEKVPHQSFDMILMDIQMPLLDGHSATRALRAKGFHKPIIALTAHAFKEERDRCLAAGCTDYFSKPIDRRLLENRLVELAKELDMSGRSMQSFDASIGGKDVRTGESRRL